MKTTLATATLMLSLLCSAVPLMAQQTAAADSVVPSLVKFSGTVSGNDGKPLTGTVGVTFLLYKEQTGGTPLWLETQNVQADQNGRYSVMLGAASAHGLPADVFAAGEARWLAVQPSGEAEQPRTMLISVPYALKALDAETVGGLPASAFMLAAPPVATGGASTAVSAAGSASPAVSGTGKTDYVPLWTNSTGALGNSVLFQSGTGTTAKIGINTTSPAATLDVNGAENVHGALNLMASGTATSSGGKNSQPFDLTASAFNSSTKAAVAQKFQWQAEPLGNNTASPGGALSLLYGAGTATPAETGLKIASDGIVTFASGQTFPGSGGSGTVTSVALAAPTSDFTVTGSPVKTSGTLNFAWNVVPTPNATANAIVKRDSNGGFEAGAITGNLGVSGFVASGVGVYGQSNGSASGSNGVQGVTLAGPGSGVAGFNEGSGGGIGVYGNGGSGSASTGIYGTGAVGVFGTGSSYGFQTDSNVQQARSAGGWVKGMAYVNAESPPYQILKCFNSTLTGAAATTPPCGINFLEAGQSGFWNIDFGFEVDDRFFSATLDYWKSSATCVEASAISPNTVQVVTFSCGGDSAGGTFHLIVY